MTIFSIATPLPDLRSRIWKRWGVTVAPAARKWSTTISRCLRIPSEPLTRGPMATIASRWAIARAPENKAAAATGTAGSSAMTPLAPIATSAVRTTATAMGRAKREAMVACPEAVA